MQKSIEDIRNLLSKTDPKNAGEIVRFLESKLQWLKICYKNSDDHFKRGVLDLINYEQLKCYLTEKPYSNSDKTKKIDLDDIVYDTKSIKNHIKRLPDTKQSIDIYNFYFGGYRDLFNVFTIEFLTKTFKKDNETFLNDILSARKTKTNNREKLHIAGAIIIDKEFIQNVKSGKSFTMPEFYTAKQNEACQWYGIIAGYDVQRDIYPEIKKIAKESFFDTSVTIKVSLVLCGAGGVGKSTILRKIAIELAKEPFTVLWIKNTHIREFIEKDLSLIEKDSKKNYLLIVEDWYRIFQRDFGLEKQFLAKTDSIPNVRIIVGDRFSEGKNFMKHLNNRSKIFQLGTDENEKIISKISDKFPKWRKKIGDLFIHESHYQSSLFLLLFVLVRITENEDHSNLNLSEPETAFVNIITSDLEYIYLHPDYRGLAKTLYHWSFIYSKHRTFITYETFLKIADCYQEGNNLSEYLDWETENPVMDRLKLYVNIDDNIEYEYYTFRDMQNDISYNFIQFNHDILSDKGISAIQSKELGFFSNKEKKQLIDIIIEFGDDVSASNLLNAVLREENGVLRDPEQKKHYISKLIDKKNSHNAYLSYLIENKAYKTEFKEYFDAVFCNEEIFYLDDTLKELLNDLILEDKDWKIIHEDYVYHALQESSYEKTQIFVHKVLVEPDWKTIDYLIFNTCLRKCEDEKLKEDVCNKVLKSSENEIVEYGCQINTALRESTDETIKHDWAIKILTHAHWRKINSSLIEQCIALCTIPEIQENFCKKVLTADIDIENDYNLHSIFATILRASFVESKITSNKFYSWFGPFVIVSSDPLYFDSLKQHFIDRLFDYNNSMESCQINTSNWLLLITALSISNNQVLKQKYAEQVLNQGYYNAIDPRIICIVLEISTNHELKKLVVNKILNGEYRLVNGDEWDEEVFFTTLKISRSEQLALFYLKRQHFEKVKLPGILTDEYKNLLLSLSILQDSTYCREKEVIQLRKLILDYPFSTNKKKDQYHNQMNKKFYDLLLEWNEISAEVYKAMVIDTSFEKGTDSLYHLYDYLELNFFDNLY